MATIATVRSKYRFIGASKFSVSGEVLGGYKCILRAKLAKRAKCLLFSGRNVDPEDGVGRGAFGLCR
jgi:hypothetical protein